MAGELLTRPGQIEWDDKLIGLNPNESGYWLMERSSVEGFSPLYIADDLPSIDGAFQGLPTPQPSYPGVQRLAVGTQALARALESSMHASRLLSPLAWWDFTLDQRIQVMAAPRLFQVTPGSWYHRIVTNSYNMPYETYFFVDVGWIIPKPAEREIIV